MHGLVAVVVRCGGRPVGGPLVFVRVGRGCWVWCGRVGLSVGGARGGFGVGRGVCGNRGGCLTRVGRPANIQLDIMCIIGVAGMPVGKGFWRLGGLCGAKVSGCPQVGELGPAPAGAAWTWSISGRCVRSVVEYETPEFDSGAQRGAQAGGRVGGRRWCADHALSGSSARPVYVLDSWCVLGGRCRGRCVFGVRGVRGLIGPVGSPRSRVRLGVVVAEDRSRGAISPCFMHKRCYASF